MESSQTTGHVMTLANSIIGVAILSMPFCFQRCGIILSILLLAVINVITRICCHYLLKSSILCRRKSMETMSLHIFGSSGKLLVELCIIGYLMGTCVAYFVVVGDIGPQIIAKQLDVESTNSLRICVMCIVTVICVIPLGLLKNVDSLSTVCMASMGFYCCLVLAVMSEAQEHILNGDWLEHVYWWRWSGVLQCLPIFSLSLSCQMVVFEVYESVPNATLGRMNDIIKSAISMCTAAYILVGSFGYIAFCKQDFSGNVLLNLAPSAISDVIKIGFVISVAFSFPLVIFPCRASLYSLLYRRGYSEGIYYMPEHRFRCVTCSIIVISLIIGILTPSIELIIGLVGSTIGVAICIMFPASCFVKVGKKDSADILLAKVLFFFGVILMILGTYANLVAIEDKTSGVVIEDVRPIDSNVEVPIPIPALNDAQPVVDIKNVSNFLRQPPKIHVKDISLDNHLSKNEIVKEIPLTADLPAIPVAKVPPHAIVEQLPIRSKPKIDQPKISVDINREALLHEDAEMAAEAKDNVAGQEGKLQQTKQLVQEIKQIKDELVKQNQDTQNMVIQKFVDLAEKVEHIEKIQEEALLIKTQQNNDNNIKPISNIDLNKTMAVTSIQNDTKQTDSSRLVTDNPKLLKDPLHKRFEAEAAILNLKKSKPNENPTIIVPVAEEESVKIGVENVREVPLTTVA